MNVKKVNLNGLNRDYFESDSKRLWQPICF